MIRTSHPAEHASKYMRHSSAYGASCTHGHRRAHTSAHNMHTYTPASRLSSTRSCPTPLSNSLRPGGSSAVRPLASGACLLRSLVKLLSCPTPPPRPSPPLSGYWERARQRSPTRNVYPQCVPRLHFRGMTTPRPGSKQDTNFPKVGLSDCLHAARPFLLVG
jgi:hypothetical protein